MPKTTKEEFKEISDKHPGIPLFMSYPWLEAVSPIYDILIYSKKEVPLGIFVFSQKKKYGLKRILNPVGSPYAGFWPLLNPARVKGSTFHDRYKKMADQLLLELPSYDDINLRFDPQVVNMAPFQWKDFRIDVRYTFILDLEQSQDTLFSNFRQDLKRTIKKEEDAFEIISCDNPDLLYNLKLADYQYRNTSFPFAKQDIRRVIKFIENTGQGNYWLALDSKGETHAAIIIVRDKYTAYYWSGVRNPDFPKTNALSILLWKAVLHSRASGMSHFNFEGSMIPAIYRHFASFGGEARPFYTLRKTKNLIFKFKNRLA